MTWSSFVLHHLIGPHRFHFYVLRPTLLSEGEKKTQKLNDPFYVCVG